MTNEKYNDFISSKIRHHSCDGVPVDHIPNQLYDFQIDILRWSLDKGRAAIFADCGLGKTPMQLAWADNVHRHTDMPVLILAPLAVSAQTAREGSKFGIDVNIAVDDGSIVEGINVTNYDKLHLFDTSRFGGIVLDESSILKSYDGKTKQSIIDAFSRCQYRLACTATPAPNDYMELGNHAEFLGVCSRAEMLATYFVHDGGDTSKWRLKGHAVDDFWTWVCSWAVMVRQPSDLGYDDSDFRLPPINYVEHICETGKRMPGKLFADEVMSLSDRREARRMSMENRIKAASEIANSDDNQYLIWCDLNAEGDALERAIDGGVQVAGKDSQEQKESRMLGFASGDIRVLITKPKIAGFGMNWQNCSRVIFVGLNDSYEQYYQAVRRCWRFGQKETVTVHIVSSDLEGAVVANVKRKEAESNRMAIEMQTRMNINSEIKRDTTVKDGHSDDVISGKDWELYLGDCVDVTSTFGDNSIDYTIFSPPFSSLYTYSDSPRDMGNCSNDKEFMEHFSFLVDHMFRVTKPGRLLSFHCMNLPASKSHHGFIGLRDFRGELIRMFISAGWIYHSEVCIWKDPVTAMHRTKALGLLYKQLKKDSCRSRQGIPDYLVTVRKPGENDSPVTKTPEDFPVGLWQNYASPIWDDINPSDTLQYRSAREQDDEKHICPLQLEVIKRAIRLWTNEGDLVFSPFAGIGSELYCAIEMGRRGLGVELKQSYFDQAAKNCAYISTESDRQQVMFK